MGPLSELGIVDAFIDGSADFSGINEGDSMFIDTVIHKTMIKMDEKGLVAAAVTLIGMRTESVPIYPDPVLFKADHSFQMFIIDGEHDNTVLFMGQINDPGIPEGSAAPQYDESDDDVWTDFALYDDDVHQFSTTDDDGKNSAYQFSTMMMIITMILTFLAMIIV